VVVAGAIACRDFMPAHHDRDYAETQGAPDILMNILTTNGYAARYVTDWAGPEAMLGSIAIRLGAPAVPGYALRFTGQVMGLCVHRFQRSRRRPGRQGRLARRRSGRLGMRERAVVFVVGDIAECVEAEDERELSRRAFARRSADRLRRCCCHVTLLSVSGLLDRFDLELEARLLAHQEAAGLDGHVPGEPEVLAIDLGGGREAGAPGDSPSTLVLLNVICG
jgi:MaoC like domain